MVLIGNKGVSGSDCPKELVTVPPPYELLQVSKSNAMQHIFICTLHPATNFTFNIHVVKYYYLGVSHYILYNLNELNQCN